MAGVRPHQIVVWGATGFTGRLVCEHLAQKYQGKVRWAMAGRNSQKLEDLRKQLTQINPACTEVPILLADGTNKASLDDMLSKTDVVLSTVGPFSLHGSLLVESSVDQGTHYCDITGEVPFVKQVYQKLNKKAEEKEVKIVHCCGYDSVPSDIGTYFVVDYVKKELGKNVSYVEAVIHADEVKGSVSGGTVESIMAISKVYGQKELGKMMMDPYYLVPDQSKRGSAGMGVSGVLPRYNSASGRSTALSMMEACNGRIVYLSNSLRNEPYGQDFKFYEYLGFKGWLTGRLSATIGTAALMFGGFMISTPLAPVIRKYLPAPGEGPAREAMLKGAWAQTMVAHTEEPNGAQPEVVTALIADRHGDPGYWSTSRMLLECGLCLALQKQQLDQSPDLKKGGVMTPAAAFGGVLVNRLKEAGYVLEVLKAGNKQ